MRGGRHERWLGQEGIAAIRCWARKGLSIREIVGEMGMSHQTLYRWRRQYPQVAQALGAGSDRREADHLVEEALLKNALGFHYTEQVVATRKEVQYQEGRRVREISEPVVLDLVRFRPGEIKAQEFWLRNRLRENWREKPEEQGEADALEAARELLGGVDSAF